MFISTSGRWVVGREVGSSQGVAVSLAHSKDLRQLGQLSDWQVYDGKEWGPQAVSIWVGGQEGSNMIHKSSLPPNLSAGWQASERPHAKRCRSGPDSRGCERERKGEGSWRRGTRPWAVGCSYGCRAHIPGRGRFKCDLGPRQPTDEYPLEGGTDIRHRGEWARKWGRRGHPGRPVSASKGEGPKEMAGAAQ